MGAIEKFIYECRRKFCCLTPVPTQYEWDDN